MLLGGVGCCWVVHQAGLVSTALPLSDLAVSLSLLLEGVGCCWSLVGWCWMLLGGVEGCCMLLVDVVGWCWVLLGGVEHRLHLGEESDLASRTMADRHTHPLHVQCELQHSQCCVPCVGCFWVSLGVVGSCWVLLNAASPWCRE